MTPDTAPNGDQDRVTETAALRQVVEAVNGFVYAGDRLNAIVDTVKYLRENPTVAATLLEATDGA